ncbi:MAG: prepilin-type N-terminal cleavage/methylation domain-containing protein, partial [Verrucomicrobia bacterium]|nr:prepilin-type N-terminal cleavage/methylation domain-containing protein [Verrucomicrobiota bacterium]
PAPGSRLRAPGHKTAFTLIELMVVIVIMAALMLFALPTFQGANRGSRLRTAAFQLSTTLTLARQNAITRRTITHVIIPDNDPSLYQGSNTNQVDKAFRAYAPYSAREGYLGEWRYLPPGVIFHPLFASGLSKNLFTCDGLPPPPVLNFLTNVPFATASGPIKSVLSIGFRPDGVLHRSAITAVGVYLTEGTVDANLVPQPRTNAPVVCLDVHNITGRVRTREYLSGP